MTEGIAPVDLLGASALPHALRRRTGAAAGAPDPDPDGPVAALAD